MQIKSPGLLLMLGFISLLGACNVATAEGENHQPDRAETHELDSQTVSR